MIPYPRINPDLITIGPIRIRWYGVMYILGFLASYFLIQKQKRAREVGLVGTTAQDLIFYLAIGVIIGGRLGHVIFFEYSNYRFFLQNPLEIIATWHGGMSFHGGLIGAITAGMIFARRRGIPFWALADSAIVTTPIGLGLGRIGNFINGELFGRPTSVPWSMIFPDGGPLARHPSQLYEAVMEGAVLFIVLWTLRQRPFRDGMMVAFFLFFYGIFRFFVEFFREPDFPPGIVLGFFSMGQVLCIITIAASILLALYIRRTQPVPSERLAASANTKSSPISHKKSPRKRRV